MFEAIQELNGDQKVTTREIGFGGILGLNIASSPSRLGHSLAQNLDNHNLITRT